MFAGVPGTGKRHPKLAGAPERAQAPLTRWHRGWESCVSPGSDIRGGRLQGRGGEGGPRCRRPREKQGMGWDGRPHRGEGSAPLAAGVWALCGGCPPACLSPGSVTKAWQCWDALSFRNLLRFQRFSGGGQTGKIIIIKKKKLKEIKVLVALQNCVHRVSGQEPSLAFIIRSPRYGGSGDPSGRAGAARRTRQSNPLQPRARHLNRGSPCLGESSMLLIKRSYPPFFFFNFIKTPPGRVRFLRVGRQPASVGRCVRASDSPPGAGSGSAHPRQTSTREAA